MGKKILIVNEDGYVEEIEARKEDVAHTMTSMSKGGALINLPGKSDFKGLAIWNKTLPQDRFEEILATFKFTK